MKTSRTKRHLRLKERPQAVPTDDNPFLMLGGSPSIVPDRDLLASSDQPLLGIILIGSVESSEFAALVEQLPDPAIPLADFGNNRDLRRDFVGEGFDGSRIEELKQHFAPIWRRLDEFPFRAGRDDRAEMMLLRLAYSRETMIEAKLAADSPPLVEYPMLGRSAAIRQRLEMLAGLHLLRRRHFIRTHVCSKCTSARLNVQEVCPAC
jgi:Thaumarchaeal output domain 1